MNYKTMMYLQKCLYINSYVYLIWTFTELFYFFVKNNNGRYDDIIKYLTIALFLMFTTIECLRLYLGQSGNLLCRVPELASFLMLSVFMQLPLITYFLFNPYLMNTPLEVTLHAVLWITILLEILLSFQALKQASTIAKDIYFSTSRTRLI